MVITARETSDNFHSSYQGLGFKGWILQHSGTQSLGVLGCDQSMSKVGLWDF